MIDGKSIAVSGRGWIDREWSSQSLGADQTGWDWLSLHLGDGEKLMLFRLRHKDGRNNLSATSSPPTAAPSRSPPPTTA